MIPMKFNSSFRILYIVYWATIKTLKIFSLRIKNLSVIKLHTHNTFNVLSGTLKRHMALFINYIFDTKQKIECYYFNFCRINPSIFL